MRMIESAWGPRGPTWTGGSAEVEAVEVHDLVPRGDEVLDEPLLRVVAGVDLGDGPELGVGTEDEIGGRRRPTELTRRAIDALVLPFRRGRRLPLGAHVEQVHEEVVRE